MAKQNLAITLNSDGFSIHTFELWHGIKHKEMQSIIARLYSVSGNGSPQIYPSRKKKGVHLCNYFSEHGIRVILHTGKGMDNGVHLIINPRKLVDPISSYLGIMPRDRKSFDLLSENFTDIMRIVKLPEFLDDWQLTRLDFCVNLKCNSNKLPREFIRTAQKMLPPSKYSVQRFKSEKLSQKQCNQINKHYLKLKNNSVAITIYDKTYQVQSENLLLAYEKLSHGILRAEVRYEAKYIKKAAAKYGLKGTGSVIYGLALNSREVMLKHFNMCFPSATFRKPEELEQLINTSGLHTQTKEHMHHLAKSLRRKHTIQAALSATALHYHLTERTALELLERFEQLDVSPIPLRKNFKFDSLTSIPKLLEQLDDEPIDEITYLAE